MTGGQRIVVLGMMTKMPVAGVVWQTLHYLLGFEALGFETYYVESHARTPSSFSVHSGDDGTRGAVEFLARIMHRFGFDERWCFRALHGDGQCYGMSLGQLHTTYSSAEVVINLCGGTLPRIELLALDRLVYLETDPVQLEIEVAEGNQNSIQFLQAHNAHFTYAENLNGDSTLPSPRGFDFQPTRQPVVLSHWDLPALSARDTFTTIGNWRQEWRDIAFDGRRYSWSKHKEFLKVLGLPARTGARFELALASCNEGDRVLLKSHGWDLREAAPMSQDIDAYRHYIATSLGEFTVAKEQNVVFRTGWFSDRSATYLAAGRPVITQDTGFDRVLPIGTGLHSYRDTDQAAVAVERVMAKPREEGHRAREIAATYFSHEVVLGDLLDRLGISVSHPSRSQRLGGWPPPHLSLEPLSKDPLVLDLTLERSVMQRPLDEIDPIFPGGWADPPEVTLIVPMRDRLALSRLCIESILANTATPTYEIVAIDDGSCDATPDYLEALTARHAGIRAIRNQTCRGFATSVNRGLQYAKGDILVVLNNDTVVPPGWLAALTNHLGAKDVGLVGAVSPGATGLGRVARAYGTFGGFRVEAATRAANPSARVVDRLTFFCIAMRRDVYVAVGPLDERFEVGMFEDDDYCRRVRLAGFSVLCADDVLVHHFGRGTLGALVPSGEYSKLFEANRKRFTQKWSDASLEAPADEPSYARLVRDLPRFVHDATQSDQPIAILSRGDDRLLALPDRSVEHFPDPSDNRGMGYPAGSDEAIAEVDRLRKRGVRFLVIPVTAAWWLDYYPGLAEHLTSTASQAATDPEIGVIYDLVTKP